MNSSFQTTVLLPHSLFQLTNSASVGSQVRIRTLTGVAMWFDVNRMFFAIFKMILNEHKVVMAAIRMDNIDDSLMKTSVAFVDVRSAANLMRAI